MTSGPVSVEAITSTTRGVGGMQEVQPGQPVGAGQTRADSGDGEARRVRREHDLRGLHASSLASRSRLVSRSSTIDSTTSPAPASDAGSSGRASTGHPGHA